MKLAGDYDLRELHRRVREANNITQFCEFMRQLDMEKLSDAYEEQKARAPRRKEYFVGHTGKPTTRNAKSNRREEHLAMALCNDFEKKGGIEHEKISKLEFLDYQLPLTARGGGVDFGEVDLFGVIDDAHPCVVELKIGNETPLRALLEALAYCAIVEANIEDIAKESRVKFRAEQPRLLILAPNPYWQKFIEKSAAGKWQPEFVRFLQSIRKHIGVRVHLAALPDDILSMFSMGDKNTEPRLRCNKCILKSVRLEG
ncbi:MAG: conserved hypothetical protein [Arenicellales bacterium IbO2]|nr:MAG: conserved hypothetical protein [Arenicellales bacterium IbO2]